MMMKSQSLFSELLQLAVESRSLIQGKKIHALIITTIFRPCMFLQNNLLNMYCKCGELAVAQKLFDSMTERDAVSWNALIAGYFQAGFRWKSMRVFNKAMCSGAKLDRFTYATMLSVCSQIGDVKVGKVIHGIVTIHGFYQHVFLTNSLIDMYSKCGAVNEARRTFDKSEKLDDVSWNSLVAAYARIGSVEEAWRVFAQLHSTGMRVNPFAFGSLLKCCASTVDGMKVGEIVHGCLVKVGLLSDVFMGSAMIDLYAKNGFLRKAFEIFKSVPDPNVVVFNSMIAGFCQLESHENNEISSEALILFPEMQRRHIRPSKFTFSSVLKACNRSNDFEFGKQIHGQVFKSNLQKDEFILSALIDMYLRNGSIGEGLKCFHSGSKQDVVTWTSMISGCVHASHFERALSMFCDLLRVGLKPDQFTLSSLMSACANLAVARSGEQIQCYALKTGYNWFTIIGNSQIFMYARSGDVDAANQTFREMQNHDVVSWSAVISNHAQHGCAKDALSLFKEMTSSNVLPNHVTLLSVLTACSHGGLVDEGFRYYESMKKDYNLDPNVKHCACIVDLLGRVGRLADAEKFILDSGFIDDPILWRALLSSCRIHKDTKRGTYIAQRIMELEPHASASYVLLYNMYLDAGAKSLAMKTRDLMKERGVKKEPGLSWIEIGARVHCFVVGDMTHPESVAIYAKLEEMLLNIKKMGYDKIERLEIDDPNLEHVKSLMNCHSEQLAVALGMIRLPALAPIRVMKNLRICMDCHTVMKFFSLSEGREIVLRDPIRFHRFRDGLCSCGDFW